jgi:hypothetical protein
MADARPTFLKLDHAGGFRLELGRTSGEASQKRLVTRRQHSARQDPTTHSITFAPSSRIFQRAAPRTVCRILDASRFPEPCGQFGLQPSPKHKPRRAHGSFHIQSISRQHDHVTSVAQSARVVSRLPIGVDHHHRKEPRLRQLLALHDLRRGLERLAPEDAVARGARRAVTRTGHDRHRASVSARRI